MTKNTTQTRPLNVNATADQPYCVNIWMSNPADGNDDCLTGDNFATNEEACAAFMAAVHGVKGALGSSAYCANWMYAEVDGPDVYLVAKNPKYSAKRAQREAREADSEWRNERAMQAGMACGCDGYNDEMGY